MSADVNYALSHSEMELHRRRREQQTGKTDAGGECEVGGAGEAEDPGGWGFSIQSGAYLGPEHATAGSRC